METRSEWSAEANAPFSRPCAASPWRAMWSASAASRRGGTSSVIVIAAPFLPKRSGVWRGCRLGSSYPPAVSHVTAELTPAVIAGAAALRRTAGFVRRRVGQPPHHDRALVAGARGVPSVRGEAEVGGDGVLHGKAGQHIPTVQVVQPHGSILIRFQHSPDPRVECAGDIHGGHVPLPPERAQDRAAHRVDDLIMRNLVVLGPNLPIIAAGRRRAAERIVRQTREDVHLFVVGDVPNGERRLFGGEEHILAAGAVMGQGAAP